MMKSRGILGSSGGGVGVGGCSESSIIGGAASTLTASSASFKFSARNYRNLDPLKPRSVNNNQNSQLNTSQISTTRPIADVKSKLLTSVKDLRKSLKSLLIEMPTNNNINNTTTTMTTSQDDYYYSEKPIKLV